VRIDLYTRCWNDGHMLPFLFRHYDNLVQRYVVYDDGSTDNSLELLRSHAKVEVRPMPEHSDPQSRSASGLALLERCWKESRGVADWVIVTDVDEFLFHPDIARYLGACKRRGVTIIPALGYEMMSDEFPPQDVSICHAVTTGAPCHLSSKMNIFSPNEIVTTNFAPGRHSAAPEGRVVLPPRDELLLLHYKYLGFERIRHRHQQYLTRQKAKDLQMGWAVKYTWSEEELREHWNGLASQLIDISAPNLRPWKTHKAERWWEHYPRTGLAIMSRLRPIARRLSNRVARRTMLWLSKMRRTGPHSAR
jgi:Glycosyl transferase family 2